MTTKLRLLNYKNTPSLDIYFRHPLKDLIAEGGRASAKRPIARLGPNSFFCNGEAVIIRYATKSELDAIGALNPARCAYVIDDDLVNIEQDASLPADYRDRLSEFRTLVLPDIIRLSDTIVAPNRLIHAAYSDKDCLFLNPSYTSLCRDFSHFDEFRWINIVFTGTRSHLNDLAFIADAILDLCAKYPAARVTTFLGRHAPERLQGRKNIVHRKPKSWRAFITILRKERFHIALAPYLDTPFNRARSVNKVLDHGALGAAGIYSRLPPLSDVVGHGKSGLLVGEDASAWQDAIERLIMDRDLAQQLARAGAAHSETLGDPRRIRRFWTRRFGL